MNDQDARRALQDALATIVPRSEVEAMDPDADMRDELDLDSMDLLNVTAKLEEACGVSIPDRELAGLTTVDKTVAWLVAHTGG